jgi:hypothetical protein
MTRYNDEDEEDDEEDYDDDSTTTTTSSTSTMRTILLHISQFLGLTPNRSLLLHLLLIGYPFQYGLLPMGLPFYKNTNQPTNHHPCESLFATCPLQEDDDDSLKYGFGLHAVVFYELVVVLWVVLQLRPTAAIVTFHQVLLWTSLLTLGICYFAGSWLWKDSMYYQLLTCYVTACLLSAWTVFVHPKLTWSGTVKWSIPANSIFYAAVIQLFMAIRALQALVESNDLKNYRQQQQQQNDSEELNEATATTQFIRWNTGLGHYYMFLHAVLLIRIRTFLQVSQLRFICLYQLLVQLVLLFWVPTTTTSVGSFVLSISILIGYLNGFLWAGRAEGISRMLSGEKED